MASLNGIDMNGVEAETPRGALPPGDYQAVITDSELKPTKNGGGQYLELVLQVQEGPYKGRKVWDRLNLFNSNQTAVVIAKQRLATAGVDQITGPAAKGASVIGLAGGANGLGPRVD